MDRAIEIIRPHRRSFRLMSAFLAATLCVTTGCTLDLTDGGDPNNDPNNGDPVAPTREIVNFNSNFSVSELDVAISVLYNVEGTPDSISGFFVKVADGNPGAIPIADAVITAVSLPGGASQFKFDPAASGVGFFRVGLIVVEDGAELPTIESIGTVQVQGRPQPFFIQPIDSLLEVTQGDPVVIRFDAGDPEGNVRWRLFYLSSIDPRNNLPDNLGKELALGEGNVGISTLDTTTLEPGDYELGVSATDTGNSISATVANGAVDRIVTVFGPVVRVVEATTP